MATKVLTLKIGADITELNAALGKASGEVKRNFGNILQASRELGVALTGIGAAITAPLGLAFREFNEFNKGMREVNSLVNLGEKEFQALSSQVIRVSSNLGTDATGAVRGLYEALSAGVPTENAVTFLEVASKAAIAGVTDTKVAIDGMTTVINSWKLSTTDATKVADAMFIAVKLGKTTFAELASSMSTVAPIAATVGVSLEQVLAAVTTLTKQGVPTEQAMTQIRSSIVGILTPNKEMNALFEKLGVSSGEMLLKTRGLQGAYEALAQASDGNNEILTKALGRVEALGAVLSTTGANAQGARDDLAAVGQSAGAMGQAFDELQKGRAVDLLFTQFKNLSIEIGSALAPAISAIIPMIQNVVSAVSDWIRENPNLTAGLVTVAGAFGALALAIGPVLIALPGIVSLIGMFSGAAATAGAGAIAASGGVGVLGTVIAALTGPVGLTIAAIAGLVAAGVALYKNSETVRDTVKEVWESLSTAATEIFGEIKNIVGIAAKAILKVWNEHKDVILPVIESIWKLVKGLFDAGLTNLKAVLTGGLKILSGVVEVWAGFLTGDFSKFTEGLGKIWDGIWIIMAGMAKAAQKTLMTAVQFVWNAVTSAFELGKTAALGWWTGLWNALTGVVNAAWNSLKGAVQGVTDGVTGFFKGMYDKVVGHSIVPDMIRDIGVEFGKLPNSMSTPVNTDIKRTIGLFTEAFKGDGPILSKIGAAAKSIIEIFTGAGSKAGGGLLDSLSAILTGGGSGGGGGLGGVLGGIQKKISGWLEGLGIDLNGIMAGIGGIMSGVKSGGAGGFLSGALGGAQAGAAIGSFIMPGIGTAVGAAIGAAAGAIASLFGKDQDKIDDTITVQQGWPEIWGLQHAFANAPAQDSPESEVATRAAVLGAGITGWNEMVKIFKRPESKESQRPYIFDFIKAVDETFKNRIVAFADFTPGALTLPVQPMARGGRGTVDRPTLFLAGEDGPEDYAFRPRGRKGRNMGANIIQNINVVADDLAAQRRMLSRVNRELVRQLS